MMPANLVFDEQSPRGLQTVILLLCPHMEKRKKEREREREGGRERERAMTGSCCTAEANTIL